MKKSQLIEHFKTVILVVLFFTTILLLYLCFNQRGKIISVSDFLPGGHSNVVSINSLDYYLPEYTVQSKGDGSFAVSFDNKENVYKATQDCSEGLLASTGVTIIQIDKEEYEAVSKESKAIQSVFAYDVPFDDFCVSVIGKTLEKPENLKGFNSILFSNIEKECIFLKDSNDNCFKVIAGENYYSIDRYEYVIFFEEKLLSSAKNLYNPEAITKKYNRVIDSKPTIIDNEELAEKIFSDTFDFVRKITDSFGNETYMYGYGQKRLTIYTDGRVEFKQELEPAENPYFYSDIETVLMFMERTIGLGGNNFKLKAAYPSTIDGVSCYHFEFENSVYDIAAETSGNAMSYFYMQVKD